MNKLLYDYAIKYLKDNPSATINEISCKNPQSNSEHKYTHVANVVADDSGLSFDCLYPVLDYQFLKRYLLKDYKASDYRTITLPISDIQKITFNSLLTDKV